jgi:PKD repeat protein
MMLRKFWQPFFSVLLITGLILTTDAPLGSQAARQQKSTTGIRIKSDPDHRGVFKPIGSYTFLDSNFDKTTNNAIEDPVITIEPEAMLSFQTRGEIVTKYLTIGNEGGADLDWSIYEDPLAWQPTLLPLREASHVVSSPGRITIGSGSLASAVNRDTEIVSNVLMEQSTFLIDLISITHSHSQEIMEGNSVACSDDGGSSTAENGFLRTFFLEDFGIYGDYEISQVSFGIEALNDNSIDITVNLYTLDALEFTYANMTLIGSSSETIPPQALTIMSMPISATAPAGSTLVVEIDAPDMSDTAAFFIGSNDQGQTASSYIRSVSCGMPQPTDFSAIGFPNVHIVINVTGEPGPPVCDAPGSIDWIDVAPTSGTIEPDSSQSVEVTFDSSSLELGSYSTHLCLASNDPTRPLAIVPLNLEVVENVAIDVTPISFEFVVSAGQQDHDTLTIHNVGAEDLIWTIDAEEIFTQAVIQSSFSEGFDNIDTLIPNGWFMQNNSQPLGVTDWFQGNPTVFPSHQGVPDSYIGANFNNTAGAGTISNWLLTPPLELKTGDTVSFYTNSLSSNWEDRLQVRMSTQGASTNVGTDAMDVGDFTSLLLDINPEYAPGGYPTVWTEFVVTISGMDEPALGRIGFRYFVEDGGPGGANSDNIGLDTFEYVSFTPCATPGEVAWLSAEPSSGTTPAGESDNVTVTVDTSGLAPNEMYEANLCIFSNDPVQPLVVVPLNIEVVPGVALTAGFTFAPDIPAVGQIVDFTNTTTGTESITYEWDFGDGGTSTDIHPTYIYTVEGNYEVTLVATNEYGTDTYSAIIVVEDLPTEPNLTLDLSVVPSPVLLGQPATFTAVVTNIGEQAVHGVMASGEMPDHVIFVEASAACTFEDNILTCDLGTIEPGESKSAWVTVIFTATGPFSIDMEVGIPGYDPVGETIEILVETQLFLPLINRQ